MSVQTENKITLAIEPNNNNNNSSYQKEIAGKTATINGKRK